MDTDVLGWREIDGTRIDMVGGKAAHLAELSRIDGIRVPDGFCVTADVYRRTVAHTPSVDELLERLSRVHPDDRVAIRASSAELRRAIEAVAVPDEVATAITTALASWHERAAVAVRSSATAEDLPGASFAGQQDTYLNVIGPEAVLAHVTRCWASLFTERAVTYRSRNGIDHRTVAMAVVVQRMVSPTVAGVLFTADPVTSHRKVTHVEATFGLGEALVSGRVNTDVYQVRDDAVVARTIVTKPVAVVPDSGGGTREQSIDPSRRDEPALSDEQVLELARVGRRIEASFGAPQDIEWCLDAAGFHIVQSRPITTLFPVPEVDDADGHVYVSVGHQQMMTEPMTPLGLSFWQLSAAAPMAVAAGRLFVDVTQRLASPTSRAAVLDALGRSDPLIRDALETVLARGDLVPPLPDDAGPVGPSGPGGPSALETDPGIVTELIAANEASVATVKRDIRATSGTARFDFIEADIAELKRHLFDPRGRQVFTSAMEAAWWLDEHLDEWLGEKHAADTLTRSVPHNVTSEMGLALLDVADVIRPHPDVVAFLRDHASDDGFLDHLPEVEGGAEASAAIGAYLDAYGMRCGGEIDITRPRWSERPTALIPMILSHVDTFEPGEHERRFERGRQEAAGEGAGDPRTPPEPARRGPQGRPDQGDDRPSADLHRVPGVPQVRHGQPLPRVQAGAAGGGRTARGRRRAGRAGGRLLPHVRRVPGRGALAAHRCGAHPRPQGGVPVVPLAHATAGAHLRRRGPRRRRTAAATCLPVRWWACRSRPGSSRVGPG